MNILTYESMHVDLGFSKSAGNITLDHLLFSSWTLQSILLFLGTVLDSFSFLFYSLGIYSLSPISPTLRMHLHSYHCRHLYPYNIVWIMAITSYIISWLPSWLCPRQFSTEERCNLWTAICLITVAAFHPTLNNTQSLSKSYKALTVYLLMLALKCKLSTGLCLFLHHILDA